MRIFLVEDEVMALRSLQRKIEDLNGDWEIVGTAFNGTEALPAILLANPQIVLTDICMPDMDGITLIAQLQECGSHAIPIIVSGYQEFDYAQQAMRLGVQDYLLKPVDPTELSKCLEQCASSLLQKRKKENVISVFAGENQLSLELGPNKTSYVIAYLFIANALSEHTHAQHPRVSYIGTEQLEHIMAPLLPDVKLRCIDGYFSNEAAFILSANSLENNLQERFEKIANHLHAITGEFVTIFYKAVESPSQLNSAIISCRTGAQQQMVWWKNVVSCHVEQSYPVDYKLNDQVKMLLLLLKQKKPDALRGHVTRMLLNWRDANRPAAAVTADLVFLLNSLCYSLPGSMNTSVGNKFIIENLVCFSDSWENLADSFSSVLWEFFRTEQEDADKLSAEELVAQIEDYFRTHISENITLQSLSDEMGFSKVYLCRVFKKMKNTTPIDFFTHLKIERAQEMIRAFPSMSLREIAEALGFSDMYYFSKVFKRIMGFPPSDLRSKPYHS